MIKYLLIFVVAILLVLGIYSFSNQESKTTVLTPSISEKKVEVLSQPKEVKIKRSSKKSTTVKPSKTVSQEPIDKVKNEEKSSKGLTLEDIGNIDISADEKKIDEVIIYQLDTPIVSQPLPSEEEIRQLIFKDNHK